MKKNLNKILFILSLAVLAACCAAGTAFAASPRWFGGVGIEGNNAFVEPWIRVTVTPETEFESDEEYIATFTVEQWAESGNYKLILSKARFFHPLKTEALDPDEMWEYYANAAWVPISQAENSELIHAVSAGANTAYLKLRVKPDFFQTPTFAKYLDYSLELIAELLPI